MCGILGLIRFEMMRKGFREDGLEKDGMEKLRFCVFVILCLFGYRREGI